MAHLKERGIEILGSDGTWSGRVRIERVGMNFKKLVIEIVDDNEDSLNELVENLEKGTL